MTDEGLAQRIVSENRQAWFWMLVSYMKMRTLALWLLHYPETTYEHFEAIWPYLFDQMLLQATEAAIDALAQQDFINPN